MKPISFSILLCFILSSCFYYSSAQGDDAGIYLGKINDKQRAVTEEAMGYISAVAHGKSARKIEKRRTELINAILQGKSMAKNMGGFKGDTSLSSAAFNYFSICYVVIKEDYGKIVDMEEISEQSYDAMEAYLAAQDAANQKLDEAHEQVDMQFKAFAARHGIQLIEDETKLSKMAETVNKVNKYYHEMFLIFFKSYKQELYLMAAADKKDINGIEQNKNALLKTSEEGLGKITKLGFYEGDGDLAAACRQLLQFYESEAKNKVPVTLDYYMKSENFEKVKKAMDAKSPEQRTEADINTFNKGVKEINTATAAYNKMLKETNEARSKGITAWNNEADGFLNKYTPRYNK